MLFLAYICTKKEDMRRFVVIDQETNESYLCNSRKAAASIVGCSVSTIHNNCKAGAVYRKNSKAVYVLTEVYKQAARNTF